MYGARHCASRPMSVLDNLTPFAATCIPSLSRDDRPLTLVIVAGRFVLPPAGARSDATPAIAPDQGEVLLVDRHVGDPASSSLLYEGQSAPTRPCTDLYMHGHAWAPGGKPSASGVVSLMVGRCHKQAVVFGDRVWTPGIAGASPGRPAPFRSIALGYERCFGGAPPRPVRSTIEAAEHNPVGCGLHGSERDALGQPLPNFEDPDAPIETLADRPRPCGFGPVARHWRPRRDLGGTYDQAWIDRRAPLWPADLDDRFFAAAAPGLQVTPHLEGGEPVQIVGMSPDGAHTFRLPRHHLQVRFEVGGGSQRRRLILDAVHFEPDAATFTMYWRAHVVADPLTVGVAVVRALAPWELP